MSGSIKTKLLAASLLVLLLAAFAQQSGASAAGVARVALGLAALAGLITWWVRARGRAGAGRPFQLPPRLSVAARTGLSPRCGVALVEADGGRYLVAYGDGFAQLLNALPSRPPAQGRAGRRPRKGGRP
jgi:flagellar protein FliO/FliZ